jgi:hypothetical protein
VSDICTHFDALWGNKAMMAAWKKKNYEISKISATFRGV